ncbi:MAG: type II secretion system protein N [Rubrivivax sp.]|nr:type II secretion system protein N [Rubrivivax sp.]
MRRRWFARRRPAAATSVFADTLQAGEIWEKRRRSATRYGIWGAAIGTLVALVIQAPATWLAAAVAQATGERVLLAEARGSVWSGSAVLVLTGGIGSRDATRLPGRLEWQLRPQGTALAVSARHECCLQGTTTFRIEPGLGRHTLVLPAAPGGFGQWPAAVLSGLGTPWNTLQLGGHLRLASNGARIELLQGRWRLEGQVTMDMAGISSRVSTLDELGSYRVLISGQPGSSENATLQLSTLGGSLQVSGQGQWVGPKLRFRGEASAAQGAEPALNNLLNIIGRRQGARSVITIG